MSGLLTWTALLFPRYFRLYVPEDGVLVIRPNVGCALEIRGCWDDPDGLSSPFQEAIDGLQAGPVSGLFSLGVEVVHYDHPAWSHVCDLWMRQ